MQTLPDGPAQRDASDMLDYYANLIKAHPGVCVKRDSTGKGLYATTTFTQGARVLCEPPLCAIQHHENRAHALVCAACFRFLGSIEEQLAWQLMSLTSNLPPDHPDIAIMEGKAAALACQQTTLPHSASLNASLPSMVSCPGGCTTQVYCSIQCATRAWEEHHQLLCPGTAAAPSPPPSTSPRNTTTTSTHTTQQAIAALLTYAHETNDTLRLALQVIARVILTTERVLSEGENGHGQRVGEQHESGQSSVSTQAGLMTDTIQSCDGGRKRTHGGEHKVQHDVHNNENNDGHRDKHNGNNSDKHNENNTIGTGQQHEQLQQEYTQDQVHAALLRAWQPYRYVHKALWWECVHAPDDDHCFDHDVDHDVDHAHSNGHGDDDENKDDNNHNHHGQYHHHGHHHGQTSDCSVDFAQGLQSMTQQCLDLFITTLPPTMVDRYAPLLHVNVLGRIMGMFELNNLSVVVANPLQRYLESIQDDKDAVEGLAAMLGPFAEDIEDLLLVPAQGTALYALQSCANHSCCPAAQPYKGTEDVDGAAVLRAERDIHPGEEVTISYIEEEEGYAARTAALRDYGFVCQCARCEAKE